MPGAEIHYLTKKNFANILQSNPYLEKVHCLDGDLGPTLSTLKKENFDYIIDLHHNLRTFRVKLALGIKSFAFDKLNIEKWMMTALKINRLPKVHIVDRYLATLNHFGIKNDGQGLDYFIPDKDRVPIGTMPLSHQKGYIGLVIGAALATKQLPIEKLENLCRALYPLPVTILGGPTEKEAGEKLAENRPHLWNTCGKMNLNQSADLVRQSTAVITHDTGLMHIAAALHKPTLTIWGNTIPEFGMGPYFPENSGIFNQGFEVKPLNCRPCSKIGHKECPKGHFRCMITQDIEQIADTCKKIFNP